MDGGSNSRSRACDRWGVLGRLHQLPTSKAEIVEVLIRAALLFLLLSGWLRHQLFGLQKLWRAGMLRTLTVMAEWADTRLELVATQSEAFERRCMLEMLREQMRDPNHVRERAFAIAPIVEYSCGQAPSLKTYALHHFTLHGRGGEVIWRPIERAAREALERWQGIIGDAQRQRLVYTQAIMARHVNNRGQLPLPEHGWFDELLGPERLHYLAHLVQHAADTGQPDPEALLPWVARALEGVRSWREVFGPHLRLAGALGRFYYVHRADLEADLTLQQLAAHGWLKLGRHAELSFPLARSYTLVSVLAATKRARAARLFERLKRTEARSAVAPDAHINLVRARVLGALGQPGPARRLLDAVLEDERGARDDLSYLSCYDGLGAIRLTPLGAWVLGQTEEYELSTEAAEAIKVLPNRDVVTLGDIQLATRVMLDLYATSTGDHTWHIDRDSLLEAIAQGHDLEGFETFLTRNAHEALPDTVTSLLESVARRCAQVSRAGDALLFEVEDPVVAAEIISDAKMKSMCMLTGERFLVVRAGDQRSLLQALARDRLRHPGDAVARGSATHLVSSSLEVAHTLTTSPRKRGRRAHAR